MSNTSVLLRLFGLNQSGSHRETKAFRGRRVPWRRVLARSYGYKWTQSTSVPGPSKAEPSKYFSLKAHLSCLHRRRRRHQWSTWSSADSCCPCQSLWQLPGHPFPQDSHEAVSLLRSWDKNSLPTYRKQASPSNHEIILFLWPHRLDQNLLDENSATRVTGEWI